MTEVTIENVSSVDLVEFATWVNRNIMSIRIPVPGPNHALSSVIQSVIPLYADIPNRMGIATELYGMVSAEIANMKRDKAGLDGDMKKEMEKALVDVNARQDILYRCIQTLSAQYEGASRLMTASEQQSRLLGGSR